VINKLNMSDIDNDIIKNMQVEIYELRKQIFEQQAYIDKFESFKEKAYEATQKKEISDSEREKIAKDNLSEYLSLIERMNKCAF
jgi:hypothetical protein